MTMDYMTVTNRLDPSDITDNGDTISFPVTMLVPKVLEYGDLEAWYTRQLVSDEELKRSLKTWDGKEVTINHPSEGTLVNPDDIVGKLTNVSYDNRLRAIAVLDKKSVAPKVLEGIMDGTVNEVSTGYWCQMVEESGEWNGQSYDAKQVRIMGNHLALLPGGTGRCSYGDGCGIRANAHTFELITRGGETPHNGGNTMAETETKEPEQVENTPAQPPADKAPPEVQNVKLTPDDESKREIEALKAALNEKEATLKKLAKEQHEALDADLLKLNADLKPVLENMSVCDKKALLNAMKKPDATVENRTPSKFGASAENGEEHFGIGERVIVNGKPEWVKPGTWRRY